MRVFELFAGAGGAALGLHRAGFEHAGLVEWDRHACATLREAGFGPVLEGDAADIEGRMADWRKALEPAAFDAAGDELLDTDIGGEGDDEDGDPDAWPLAREALADRLVTEAQRVDLLWSSFPCQAFSVAGKRLGAADPRNGWPWTTSALDRIKPTWFLGENVGGLLLHRGDCPTRKGGAAEPESCAGCYFSSIILGDLRARFAHVGWWLLDAADYGVPQHRQRVILWAGPAPLVKPEPTHGPGRALPWVGMGAVLGLGPEVQAQSGVGYTDSGLRGRPRLTAEPSPAVSGAGNLYVGAFQPVVAGSHDRGRPLKAIEGPSPTIGASYGDKGRSPWTSAGAPFLVYTEGRAGSEPGRLDLPAPTVATTEEKGTRASAASGWTFHGGPDRASDAAFLATGRRRLTWQECAVRQDFPADYPFQGTIGARYKQVGNAVPPKLAEVVGRAVLNAHEGGQDDE